MHQTLLTDRFDSASEDGEFLGLISDIGKEAFSNRLFSAVNSVVDCAHLSVLAYQDSASPKVILAESQRGGRQAEDCAGRYLHEYWNKDPIHEQVANFRPEDIGAFQTNAEDIDCPNYRYDCYTTANLTSRLSICGRIGQDTLKLSMYNGGSFYSERSLGRLFKISKLLLSTLKRHAEYLDTVTPTRESVTNRLINFEPSLTEREAAVCWHIFRGLTSEGIGLELGISKNTVLTYRKRAYKRLNITSQKELMHLAMS